MTTRLVDAAPSVSGAEPLVQILDTLLAEIRLAGSQGRPSVHYLRRRRLVALLARIAEQDLGLRFTAHLPFLSTMAAMTELGRPLAGYTLRHADYPPSVWLQDLWIRWQAAAQPADPHWQTLDHSGRDTDEPGPEQQRIRNDKRFHQVSSLLRGAAWHCTHDEPDDAVPAAVRYVVELAASGQAHRRAAASAVFLLLSAAPQAESAGELVDLLTDAPRPATPEQWARVGLTWPRREHRPTLTRAAQAAVGWLLGYGRESLQRARRAPDYDSWNIAMVAVQCATICVIEGLPYARADLPIGLRAVIGQFEEIHADLATLRFEVAAARRAGRPEIEGIVRWTRGIAGEYRGTLTDARLKRITEERSLMPEALLTLTPPAPSPRAPTPLPAQWQRRSWRTITATHPEPGLLRIRPESSPYTPARVTDQEMRDELSTALHQIQRAHRSADPQASHRAVADLLAHYPWHHVAYGLSAELHHAAGNLPDAISAAIAGAVLRPEQTHHWSWLARLLHAQGHEHAAMTATKIAQLAADVGPAHQSDSG